MKWNISRLGKTKVEVLNEAGNIHLVFARNPDEILASYSRLGMKPDAKALAAIMQEAGSVLNDFLRKEAEHGS